MAGTASEKLRAQLQASYYEMRALAEALGPDGLELATPSGWSAKEMLAHVAFWEEAQAPVITYMLRGRNIPLPHAFGSGPFNEDGWPEADVHNAREAAWARGQTVEAVLERWAIAQAALMDVLLTVTDEEVSAFPGQFDEVTSHMPEHMDELRALVQARAGNP